MVLSMWLMGCGAETSQWDSAPSATSPQATRLRVVSINVWSGLDYEGNFSMGEYESGAVREKRYVSLVKELKTLAPDVIGIQEANKLPGYAVRLARDLDYDQVHHVGVGGVRAGPVGLPWNLREGDAILAKREHRLKSAGRAQLSGGPVGSFFTFHLSDATQIIGGRILVQGRPVFVFTTHWHASLPDSPDFRRTVVAPTQEQRKPSPEQISEVEREMKAGGDWRKAESHKTLDFIRRMAGPHPFVLLGDLNATEDSPEIQALLSAGMTDAFRSVHPGLAGYTWDPQSNLNQRLFYGKDLAQGVSLRAALERAYDSMPRRIDYVFVGRFTPAASGAHSDALAPAWKVHGARVVLDRPLGGQHVSDHYGILADLELR